MINAAHDHFVTQTCKKPKTVLKNSMRPVERGPKYGTEGEGRRKTNTPSILLIYGQINLAHFLNQKL